MHFAILRIADKDLGGIGAKSGGGKGEQLLWHSISFLSGMKPKGLPTEPDDEKDKSEARRTTVLEFADLHDPEARKRILERANQALKDARALIERLNAMEAKRGGQQPKGTKSSKD